MRVPMHGKLQYRKSMLNYSLSYSFSVRLVMMFGPLKYGVPSLFSFQSIQNQNAGFVSERLRSAGSLFSWLLSVQYFVDCEVTMMQRGMLLIDTAVSFMWRDLFSFWYIVYLCKSLNLMLLHGNLIRYIQIPIPNFLFGIFELKQILTVVAWTHSH